MAYIAPNGTIHLLHNVPLDTSYQHTLRFSSAANQYSYFSNTSRVKRTFTNQYYTRLNRGIIRVNELADNIYDCNYLMYQNTSFGNKWFYAFIKSVEYVNNAVSQIEFEIDVMQTWYFDFELQPCFVERMHSTTDAIGDNIVAEPVEPGETVYTKFSKVLETDNIYIIVAKVDTQEQASLGKLYSKIYSGSSLKAFIQTDAEGVNREISQFLSRPDAIINIYMCPAWLIKDTVMLDGTDITETRDVEDITLNGIEKPTSTTPMVGGYIPHNAKLYTYPYTYLELMTPDGGSVKLRYEFFEQNVPTFRMGGCITIPVELTIKPTYYKGVHPSESVTYKFGLVSESLSLKNYPICSWNVDTYKAWAAQNSIPIGLQIANLAANLGIGAVTRGIALPLIGTTLVSQATNIVSEMYKQSIAADQHHGQASGSAAMSVGDMGFFYGVAMPTEQQTKVIDSFFDMFGYAQKRVMQPLRKARKIWTYLKTVGCVLDGSVPADDANHICKIHDNGITYWDVESNPTIKVGNYLLAAQNTVIG